MQKSKGDLNQAAFADERFRLYLLAVSVVQSEPILSVQGDTEGKGWHDEILIV